MELFLCVKNEIDEKFRSCVYIKQTSRRQLAPGVFKAALSVFNFFQLDYREKENEKI
jgi:hypothetical protein